MRTISIANFKGGTGKTTTACNLAALLAREGKTTLLIDADPQHNSTDFFLPDWEGTTLTDLLEGRDLDPRDFITEVRDHLLMVPADMGLLTLDLQSLTDAQTGGVCFAEERMLDFLRAISLTEAPDFVLIDCPPGFTTASIAVFVACDEVILPMKTDAFSRMGALEMIWQIKALKGYHVAPMFRVLLTMFDNRTRVSRQVVDLLHADGLELFKTFIRRSKVAEEISWARQPLYEWAPKNPVAQDYESLLREVLDGE